MNSLEEDWVRLGLSDEQHKPRVEQLQSVLAFVRALLKRLDAIENCPVVCVRDLYRVVSIVPNLGVATQLTRLDVRIPDIGMTWHVDQFTHECDLSVIATAAPLLPDLVAELVSVMQSVQRSHDVLIK